MEFSDRHSERVDGLKLREDTCLVAYLFWIQVVGCTYKPMFRSWLARVVRGEEPVESDESRSSRNSSPLYSLLRHRRDGDIAYLYITLLNLAADHLRNKVVLVV